MGDKVDEEKLEEIVENGCVPFLGTGTSTQWSNEDKRELRSRIDEIVDHVKDRGVDGRHAQSYFDSLVDEKLGKSDGGGRPGQRRLESSQVQPAGEDGDSGNRDIGIAFGEDRIQLIADLGLMTSTLVRLWGNSLERRPFFSYDGAPSLKLDGGNPSATCKEQDIVILITRCRGTLESLIEWTPQQHFDILDSRDEGGEGPDNDPGYIVQKFVKDLALDIFPTLHREYPDLKIEEWKNPPIDEPENPPLYGAIKLDQIDWLGRLIWFLLRYDLGPHPTSSELAFHLSLSEKMRDVLAGEPRPVGLSESAEVLHEEALVEAVSDLFEFCASRGTVPRIHREVARLLVHQHDEWRSDPNGQPPSMALTTNYDTNLERALWEGGEPFFVAYPLDSQVDQFRKWVILKLDPGMAEGAMTLQPVDALPWPDPRTSAEDTRLPFGIGDHTVPRTGPLIIKIHGSRRFPEPMGEEWENTHTPGTEPDPFMVMSERSYLQFLKQDTFELVNKVLHSHSYTGEEKGKDQPSRPILFIGYSLSDWNVRLQFYHTDSSIFGSKMDSPIRAVVNLGIDPLEKQFLDNTGFQFWKGDVDTVADKLKDHLNRENARNLVANRANEGTK